MIKEAEENDPCMERCIEIQRLKRHRDFYAHLFKLRTARCKDAERKLRVTMKACEKMIDIMRDPAYELCPEDKYYDMRDEAMRAMDEVKRIEQEYVNEQEAKRQTTEGLPS